MKTEFNTLAALKWLTAIAVAEWLRVPGIMRALIVLMAIDYTTGVVSAIKNKRLSSEIGWWGLVTKVMTILMLISCYMVELMIGADWKVEQIAAFGFGVNEVVSIIKNCNLIGIPIPVQLVSVLMSVQKLRSQRATPEQLADLEKGN